MSRLRRQPYTKPVPKDAELFARKGKRFARFKQGGKPVVAPLNDRGDRVRLLSAKWYGEYTDADGLLRCVPLCANKTAAGQMLAELVRKAELARGGVRDPFEKHRGRPLAEHLDDFERYLKAKDVTAKQVALKLSRVRRLVRECGFVFVEDVSASGVQEFLGGLQKGGREPAPLPAGKKWFTRAEAADALGVAPASVSLQVRRYLLPAKGQGRGRLFPRETVESIRGRIRAAPGAQTANFYLREIKSFFRWLVRDRRTGDNPVAHLDGVNVRADRRHDRRTLTPGQLAALLEAAGDSPRAFRGLAGADRRALYLCALGTGFRAQELARLCPESFDLDGSPPTATVPSAYTKNRKLAVQPLPPEVVAMLHPYLAGRPRGEPVWPGRWYEVGAEMLRIDLDAAGVPYVVEGPDGPLFADFHALRHSYIALLDRGGATLKEAMQLARHSDPRLTMAVYGRAQLHDLGRAVEKLPSLGAAAPADSCLPQTAG